MLLKVALVLALLVVTHARPVSNSEEIDLQDKGFSDIDQLYGDRKELNARSNIIVQLSNEESENLHSEAKRETSNSDDEFAEIAHDRDEKAVEELESALNDIKKDKVSPNENAAEESDEFENNNANLTEDEDRNKRDVIEKKEAEEDERDSQEDCEDEVPHDDQEDDDNLNGDKNYENFKEENREADKDDKTDRGQNKREIVTQIEKTLSEIQSVDNYLEYLNKQADALEEVRKDLGKYGENHKYEVDRSKRESSNAPNERPVDYLKSLPQYRDVPREVLANAIQSLTNGDRRHLEAKEPVQRQACSTEGTLAITSPCVGTSKAPLTKEEQELQRVIEMRKKHEANVAKEQDEVLKAEHMAHTMQQDLQEVMTEIRQLNKEIGIERREADTISHEVKEDQKDLEEHDQKKFTARRRVDELYMKLTELESNDCEARSKRQLVRQLTEIVGDEALDPFETPRQRILRELKEKEREQAELDRMMNERSLEMPERRFHVVASNVQDEQKQVTGLQKSQMQLNDQQKVEYSQEGQRRQNVQYEAHEADNIDPVARQTNELAQHSVVNAMAQPAVVQGPAPEPLPAIARQAAGQCSNSKSDSKHSQYNAILQEIIIGEAQVKIESVEVERAELEVASSRKRMTGAMSHLSALVMELNNLQSRAKIAGKRAKEAHLVLAYHDQLLYVERRKVTEALNLETDLQKSISDMRLKSGGKCTGPQ